VRFDGARLPMDVRALHTTDLDAWADDPSNEAFQEILRAVRAMLAHGDPPATGTPSAVPGPAAAVSAPSRVSICVLPFSNMSGDAEQEYFSDGISEDIITDLSKVSSLAVVSRNTAFSFKGRSVDIAQIGRRLKVGYVLEGSVRKAASRVRITAQLIEPDNLTMRCNFGCGFAAIGEFDAALELLGPVFERDAAETVNWAKVDPDLDALRALPRFKAMMELADARLTQPATA